MRPSVRLADRPSRSRRARVVVVDDHRAFTNALAARLEAEPGLQVVGTAYSAAHGLSLVRKARADVVLVDYLLGEETCLEILAAVRESPTNTEAVVVSGVDSVPDVVAGLAGGARAWVRKDGEYVDLVRAIEEVLEGGLWVSTGLVGPVMAELLDRATRGPTSFISDLTARQRQVLAALLAGKTRTQIAEEFVISPHTVRTHIQELLKRSGSSSTLELLARTRASGDAHRLPG